MIALIVDPAAPGGLRLGDAPEPRPGPGQVLIEARFASLNRGDLNDAVNGRLAAGAVLGRDVVGVVTRVGKATAEELPPVGTSVVALVAGAFAKRVVADASALAIVPDDVDLAAAATLPVAGLAAIQALRAATLDTPVKAARVLITGASGGVGRFAVQLAALGGAHVIAVAARPELLEEFGADQVVAHPAEVTEPVDVVLDTVGGSQLVAAWRLLAPGGSLQCIGWSSGEPAAFPPYATVGPPKSLSAFQITAPAGPDLASLLQLVEEERLLVEIGWQGPLARIADAVEALRARRLVGKAVVKL